MASLQLLPAALCLWLAVTISSLLVTAPHIAQAQGDDEFLDGDGDFHYDVDSTTIATGARFACALSHTGSDDAIGGHVVCWGKDRNDILNYPKNDMFVQVCAAEFNACGIRIDGTLQCWGRHTYAHNQPGSFLQVSCGLFHTCAITKQNSVQCWGQDVWGQASPPAGEFVQVSCGRDHTCAIRMDGTLQCWGYHLDGVNQPPSGEYVQVSAGPDRHTCAIRADGGIDCWGDCGVGQCDAPEGEFVQVTSGQHFTCAVDQETSRLHCWGSTHHLTGMPDADTEFAEVSAWEHSMCGILAEPPHGVECWGMDDFGGASPPADLHSAL